jgi:hypothetical protein
VIGDNYLLSDSHKYSTNKAIILRQQLFL